MINDVITAECEQRVTLLPSLDISAAFDFDTVDLNVLLARLLSDFGITGRALNWLRSFVTDRTQYADSIVINCRLCHFRFRHAHFQHAPLNKLLLLASILFSDLKP